MNKKENKLIPELRFPEFEKEGEWMLEELEQCLDYLQPTPYIVDSTNYDEKFTTPVLTAGKTFILGYTDEKDNVFSENLPVIIFDDFTTASKFVDFPFKVKSSAMKILLTKDETNIRFVYESMQNLRFEVGVHKRHWISVFSQLKIPVPKPQEQQKIASCLSSLDEVIEAHSQKLELLKAHKKGLMQNLFPQEGEKVPKLRFKEFEGEWVEKKLGELGEFLGGGTPSRLNNDYWTGNIPWISSSDIKEDDIHNVSISQYINENSIIESATKIIPKGSILFVSRVGVGKLAINNEELCTSQDFTSFIPTDILNLFVAYYFSANRNLLQALSQGTSIKGFSKSDLEDSKILYPKNKDEQQKIASCLSSLDEMIQAQAEKIEQLKKHKKGLMQGLFPKMND